MVVSGSQSQKTDVVPVHPFVEVSFQGMTVRTTAAEGSNPTWNQELQMPLCPISGDFSPTNLQSIQDHIYLHLYDEIMVDLVEDDRMRETNIHHRLERNWLGSLHIPFSTLYFNSSVNLDGSELSLTVFGEGDFIFMSSAVKFQESE
uniref:C2 domain-containing protein n=1 Tax=Timema bartmani TaxID=61472 RepID=A0A7R9F3L7_9NEOP|nr:unnamed protein product [Timema bartmani]